MSLSQPSKLSPAQKLSSTPRVSGRVSVRPYFNPENALIFQPVFDKMIEHREEQEILTATAGWKPRTIVCRAFDALKWLTEFHHEKEKYIILKSQITIRQTDVGAEFFFKPTLAKVVADATHKRNETKEAIKEWRKMLEEWLVTAQPMSVWDSSTLFPQGIVVREADREWLMGLLSSLDGCEAEITETLVKVVR